MPFPPPGDLPDPGIISCISCIAGGFFTTEPPGKVVMFRCGNGGPKRSGDFPEDHSLVRKLMPAWGSSASLCLLLQKTRTISEAKLYQAFSEIWVPVLVLPMILTQNQSWGECPPGEPRHCDWVVEHSWDAGTEGVGAESCSAETREAGDSIRSVRDEGGDRSPASTSAQNLMTPACLPSRRGPE